MSRITYQSLFAYLQQLGFKDASQSAYERIFEHPSHGILLAFSMIDDASVDRPVRDADMTSVEFRLRQLGLLSGTLPDAARKVSHR